MNRFAVLFFLIFVCCIGSNNTYAQKAAFINGNFVTAFYSEHDKQVKFVNTFTTQAFAWFHYTGAEPKMWFVGSQLIVVNEKEAIVSGLATNDIKKYILNDKPIENTLWQCQETDSFVSITNIITQRQLTTLAKEADKKISTVSLSGDEKKAVITYSANEKKYLRYYSIAETPILIWQKEINTKENTAPVLNNTGNLIALWNGSETILLSSTDGTIVQTIGDQYQVLRFTAKDELICIHPLNPKAALFTKTKNNVFKIKEIAGFKNGLFVHPNGKEFTIEWDLQYVSDDLTMCIGFGDKVVALYKNGLTFLFF